MIEKLKTSLSESEAAKSGLEQQIGELRRELSQVNASVSNQGGKNEAAIELERLRGEYRKVVEANSTMSVRNELGVEQLGRELDSTRKRLEESKERVAKLENELVHVNLQWQERYRLLEAVKVNDSDLFNRQVLDEKNQV
jgi:peptidoglycan hydrolase CwlO-like protein